MGLLEVWEAAKLGNTLLQRLEGSCGEIPCWPLLSKRAHSLPNVNEGHYKRPQRRLCLAHTLFVGTKNGNLYIFLQLMSWLILSHCIRIWCQQALWVVSIPLSIVSIVLSLVHIVVQHYIIILDIIVIIIFCFIRYHILFYFIYLVYIYILNKIFVTTQDIYITTI